MRVAVPDMARLVRDYLATEDADGFIAATHMGLNRPTGLMAWMKWVLVGPRHHLWMYDGNSLAKLLHEAGFADVAIMPPGKTNIADPGDLDLEERASESVYVEAFQPLPECDEICRPSLTWVRAARPPGTGSTSNAAPAPPAPAAVIRPGRGCCAARQARGARIWVDLHRTCVQYANPPDCRDAGLAAGAQWRPFRRRRGQRGHVHDLGGRVRRRGHGPGAGGRHLRPAAGERRAQRLSGDGDPGRRRRPLRHRPVHRGPGRGQPPGSGRPGRDQAGHDRLADRGAARGRYEGRCRGFRDRCAPRLHPRAVRTPHRADPARMERDVAVGARSRPAPRGRSASARSTAISYSGPTRGDAWCPSPIPGSAPMSLPVPPWRKPPDDVRRRTPSGPHALEGSAEDKGPPGPRHSVRQAMLPGTGMSTEAMLATMPATIQAADRAWTCPPWAARLSAARLS